MATAFVMRKRFRVAQLPRLATIIRMRPTTTAHVPNSMLAAFAEAMVFRLAHAIALATYSMPAAYAVATASLQGLAIVRATCWMSAASAEAMALRRAHAIAPAMCWMPAEFVEERG